MPNIEKLNKANKEISDLKSQLKTNEDVNNSLLDLSAARANKVNNENDELRAMVAALQSKVLEVSCDYSNNSGYEPSLSVLRRSLDEPFRLSRDIPKQCLSTTKQQAIRDAISNSEQVELAGQGYVGTYVSLDDLEVNILQLGDEL